jgi:putative cardiolipin synthase
VRGWAEDPPPYPVEEDLAKLTAYLGSMADRLVWAPTRVLFDDPAKAEDRDVRGIAEELTQHTSGAEREVLVENAYFVPRDPMLELVESLTERGVRVRVLTNSMASNDVAAVVSGYQKYRRALIERGMEAYELRPDSTDKSRWSLLSSKSRSGLHTKAMIVDREHVVIGSYNLDPRSADINSECALLIDSTAFGERVGAYLDDGVSPENAYRVTLEDGDLAWTAQVEGEEVAYDTEPETGWWQRFMVGAMGLLPIQSQL